MDFYKVNKYQTPITEELKNSLHREVWDELIDFIDNVKFIQNLMAPEEVRGFAKDRPRDKDGKIIVDLTNPHILEDMDFFRERAIFYEKNKCYTHLRPNPNPKSEYAEFWKEEKKRWEEGLIRPSDGEWIPGYYYFYLNYCQIWINEKKDKNNSKTKKKAARKMEFPKVWLGDYLFFHYFDQAIENGKHAKIIKCRGVGFEQPNSEIVKTFYGDKKVGDVVVGDKLIGIDGKECTVLDIYPQGEKDVYEVELLDGRKVRCGIDHLWYVNDYTVKRIRPVKLSDMIKKGLFWSVNKGKNVAYKYKIPKLDPVQYPTKSLPIDPYVLGALLGDGALTGTSIRIATNDSFIVQEFERRLPEYSLNRDKTSNNYLIKDNYRFSQDRDEFQYDNFKYGINRLKREIRALNLEVDTEGKFIPEIYFKGDFNQRLELLQGLMDTDGSINSTGMMEFSNSNYKLIEDTASLCRSLGIKATIGLGRPPRKKSIKGKECNIKQEYRLYINTNLIIFKLPRKIARFRYKELFDEYPIVNIRKLDYQEESSCFLVDNDTHTYLTGDYVPTHNSFKTAAISPCNMYTKYGLPNFHLAIDKRYLDGKDGLFDKVLYNLDWVAENTPMSRIRLIDKPSDYTNKLRYKHEYGQRKGLLSSVTCISLKDDPEKARGLRGPLIHYEEDGQFKDLESAWNVNRDSTEDGDLVFGTQFAGGTAGLKAANMEGSEKLFRNPNAYNIYGVPNIFDKNQDGKIECGFFWPAYLNRAECYDSINGEPDIIKALLEIIKERFLIKYNSSDPLAITQRKAEKPITPSEAMFKTSGTIFPVSDLRDYLDKVKILGPKFFELNAIGELIAKSDGKISYSPNKDKYPLRSYKTPGDDLTGALEIFEMPRKDSGGVMKNRYIAGIDPIDSDTGTSLGNIWIFDTFHQWFVAEYTGRPKFADEFYEICRRLLIFYDARANYENNLKGLFTYFTQKNSTYLLCDTPSFLYDKELVKKGGYGNTLKGTRATPEVNAYARRLLRDWLLTDAHQIFQEYDDNYNIIEKKLNMHTIKSIPFLEELTVWNGDLNCDRVSGAGMCMILNEEYKKYNQVFTEKTTEKDFASNEYWSQYASSGGFSYGPSR